MVKCSFKLYLIFRISDSDGVMIAPRTLTFLRSTVAEAV